MLAFLGDVWSVLLAIGLAGTFVTTVFLVTGWTPGRRPQRAATPATTSIPWKVSTPDAARERAAAIARAKAELAGHDRALHLTDVREVEPAALGAGAAGQTGRGGDGQGAPQEPAVTTAEATAIIAHFAEHDPTLVAEVITQWIKADVKHEARPPL